MPFNAVILMCQQIIFEKKRVFDAAVFFMPIKYFVQIVHNLILTSFNEVVLFLLVLLCRAIS